MTGRKSPWGGNGDSGDDGEPGPQAAPEQPEGAPEQAPGPRNPWLPGGNQPPRRSAGIEEIFRPRGPRGPGSRGPGGFPSLPPRPDGKSWLPLAAGAVALAWIGFTSVHVVGQKEEAIVTRMGQYSRTLGPGMSMTLPWPFEQTAVTDVTSFTVYSIPEGEAEKLMLTSDKNLVDLSYLVRWNIKNLKNYSFQLEDPEETVREVAEAAMRASIAQVTLIDAISGAGRADVEADVRERMQRVLDYYHAGVGIQGVEIKKADPPAKVVNAFQQVTVSQQEAERDRSDARGWAQQLLARAQGDAASFDKVYEQYRLAPDVTKRRMYYETMERLLRKNGSVVLEANGVTPYLPLPQVEKRALPAPDATQAGGQ
ncbi:protease modulator HflK [Novosphingobium colocasiae]|uniref:Protease modulator HflK n=1 Tax=Novosphingobium colocasiae TaxID=1256513 RepID=A0A918PE50_9SPHN|nr:protease modulator HflK [Novosphingobium colocasiae]GGZ03151.1 protease modulator HflK [Novosphingobium colocasiae]